MLIRTMQDVEAAGKPVAIAHGAATAVRLLLKRDGAGFSVSEARCPPGTGSDLWYKNHWEANVIRSGTARLEDSVDGRRWDLKPGDMYLVGPTDRHRVTVTSPDLLRVISVFNPPIEGVETHDADNAYPPTGPIPPRKDRMLVRTGRDARAAGLSAEVSAGSGSVVHLIVGGDGVGFSVSDVHLKRGHRSDHQHKGHWVAGLVLDGTLEVTDKKQQQVHRLGPGGLYCVGSAEAHQLHAVNDVHMVSVANPPIA